MAHTASRRRFDEVWRLAAFHPLLPDIARDLTALCVEGDAARARAGKARVPSVFDGMEPAAMSIQDYLVRLCKYSYCSPWTFPVMRVYIARFQAARVRKGATPDITSHNVHRLVLTCFVVAAKLRDDVYYANAYYAQVGGVSLRDINALEAHLLTLLDWTTHVEPEELAQLGATPPPPPAWGGQPAAPARAVPKKVSSTRGMVVDRIPVEDAGDTEEDNTVSSAASSASTERAFSGADGVQAKFPRPNGGRAAGGSSARLPAGRQPRGASRRGNLRRVVMAA